LPPFLARFTENGDRLLPYDVRPRYDPSVNGDASGPRRFGEEFMGDPMSEDLIETPPIRRRRRNLTVLGMLLLVAFAAIGLAIARKLNIKVTDRPTVKATYSRTAVVDGRILPREYGPAMVISWTEDNSLAAFHESLYDFTKREPGDTTSRPITVDPTKNKPVTDLSLTVQAAFSDTSLFLAFRVRDQFVDDQIELPVDAMYDDAVEVFLDADRVPNDFVPNDIGGTTGTAEGFQILVNAAGQKYTSSKVFTNDDWKSAASLTEDGYIIEMEIPFKIIDTQDGPGTKAPGFGSFLHFAIAVTDNDAAVSRQMSYAYLKTPTQTQSPFLGGEAAWTFGIQFEPRFSFLPW
jgi:hypothetical protein